MIKNKVLLPSRTLETAQEWKRSGLSQHVSVKQSTAADLHKS